MVSHKHVIKFTCLCETSDLGSGGQVVVQFNAIATGESGNGITVTLTNSDHLVADGPRVAVDGESISVDLNTNFA